MIEPDSHRRDPPSRQNSFATTHWSAVVAAAQTQSPEAEQALEALCRQYWYPLYTWVRRKGYSAPDAEDLVPIARRQNFPIPGAWLGQRLVKVKPLLPPLKGVKWPRAKTPVEQWQLTKLVKMKEVCRLGPKDVYWGRP